MTTHELADTMDRCAAALRGLPADTLPYEKPILQGEHAIGATLFWAYQRSLLTGTPQESFTWGELLVLLETMARDTEMFPPGLVELVADCDGGGA